MRNVYLLGLLALGLAVVGSSFAGPEDNSLIIVTSQEPSELNLWVNSADTIENTLGLFYIGLTYFDNQGNLQPGIATEVPTEANGRVRFVRDAAGNFQAQFVDWTIRDNAVWSDGTPITSEDVRFTFEVQQASFIPVTTRAFSDLIEDVIVRDAKNFTIKYKAPNAFATSPGGAIGLARWYDISPAHVWQPVFERVRAAAEADPANAGQIGIEQFQNAPLATPEQGPVVGSGAFVFTGWQRGQQITGIRNENFFLDPPGPRENYLDSVTLRFIEDANALLAAVTSGAVDGTNDIALDNTQVPALQAQAGSVGYTVHERVPQGFIEHIWVNQHPSCQEAVDLTLGDVRTRRALAQAIDRANLGPRVSPGSVSSNDFMVIGDVGYDASVLQPYPYDLEAAKALLADVGWSDSDGNGVLDRVTSDGRRVEFNLRWISTTAARRRETNPILRQQLAEVGINLDAMNVPGSQLFDNAFINNANNCTWLLIEFAEAGGIGQAPADAISNELFTLNLLTSPPSDNTSRDGAGGNNYGAYNNPEFDRLRAEALSTSDTERRVAALQEMQRIFSDDLPFIPLYELTVPVVTRNGLVNFVFTPATKTHSWNAWEWGWEQNGAVNVR